MILRCTTLGLASLAFGAIHSEAFLHHHPPASAWAPTRAEVGSAQSANFRRDLAPLSRNALTTTQLRSSTFPSSSGTVKLPNATKKKKLKAFVRYLEIECWKRAELRELEPVLQAVADACKQISRIVQRAQTDDLYGVAVDKTTGQPLEDNVQGEVQQQLDVLCNTIMLRAFCGSSKSIHAVASEEEDTCRCCSTIMGDTAFAVGDYIAAFDPIDGSKNIDASLPVGCIFGIYKKPPGEIDESTFLQDGSRLVAAGYCLFSATTVLVLSLGSGVDGFTLDPDQGKFLHTLRDMRIPSSGAIYSVNEANYREFDKPVQAYLNSVKEHKSASHLKPQARYVGALVADVHNVLINGGIYAYPATLSNPTGKLRLLYECAPMAFIVEQAGGAASTGSGRIMDVMPTEIHHRVPLFLGSTDNVFGLDQFYKYHGDDDDDDDDDDIDEDEAQRQQLPSDNLHP